ncbi:hypothetical protein JVT61DRAFT_6547 [Boletus reticuloceps]|uniref:DUF202 domain-containing protein n=1 Tax=Boletus reticuloceps TaxID=495285 RepID=A0A8I3A7V1_9AGAM|nr:hypothetical protein JVT61DRAFT_6547 [Boletus reticuloceps]
MSSLCLYRYDDHDTQQRVDQRQSAGSIRNFLVQFPPLFFIRARFSPRKRPPSRPLHQTGRHPRTCHQKLRLNPVTPPNVRVPRKVPTAIKVEAKVWFANERTWLSWLNAAILIGTFAVALFNASRDPIARAFAYVYAALSVGVLIYGYSLYQSRITMIRKRDPGHYDAITGPVVVSTILFVAVLANFVIRVHELRQHKIPIPGLALLHQIMPNFIPSA